MSFIDQLYSRRKILADVLAIEEYSGIRQIVEDLYPGSAHFIYELLQNAEDTTATNVSFLLKEDALGFEHNGRPFNDQDLEAITNIRKGRKGDQEDSIGRFGLGFKAVFLYTETPKIWSPTYSFKIEQLVLPYEIPKNDQLGQKTRFEFPFNNPKKPPEAAYTEVAEGLDKLAETTLLFLRHIEVIKWNIGDNISGRVLRVQHSEHHIEIRKETKDKSTISSHFLLFSTPIEIDSRPTQSVSIAYTLELLPKISHFDPEKALSTQMKITPAAPGFVAIFFPAEKETSGLRFHIHAPFVPELSRASIKETPANQPLFDKLSELAASSLHHIRDLGLLTGEFLSVLPNPQDALDKQYMPIRNAIIEAMNNEPLTPAHSKSHAPAKNLLQAKAVLKELISEQDLEYLIGSKHEYPKWAIAASQRNSNQDRFLDGLAIETWDIEKFVELLKEKTSEDNPDEEFMCWFSEKSVEWHQQMYALLQNDEASNQSKTYYHHKWRHNLHNLKIIRLRKGAYSTAEKCYFPSDGIEHDEMLPRVDRKVYESGKKKSEQEDSKKFLEKIGVREVGEVEEIESILKTRYTYESEIPDKETHFNDLSRFIKLVEPDSTKAGIFSEYYIFKGIDDSWHEPSNIFLDSPFLETGLSVYYNALCDDGTPKALSNEYQKCTIKKEKIGKFAEAVGGICELPVSETSCYYNPQWEYLSDVSGVAHTRKSINEDFTIKYLDKLFQSPSIELSKLVWQTMNNIGSGVLQARYRKNYTGSCKREDSQLVHLLKNSAWIPQKYKRNTSYVKPCDASC